jgi:hypothetical protein
MEELDHMMEFSSTASSTHLSSDVARSRMNGQELHQAGNLFWPPKPSCNSHQRQQKQQQQNKIEVQKQSFRRSLSAVPNGMVSRAFRSTSSPSFAVMSDATQPGATAFTCKPRQA